MFKDYTKQHPDLAEVWHRRHQKNLPKHWETASQKEIEKCQDEAKNMATRKASLQWLNRMAQGLPELLGGSADLSGSNLTLHDHSSPLLAPDYKGNYLHYGVREFGMAAIMNGLALYGAFIPYGGTFLVFQDYLRNAMRLSALMKQKVIYVLTHDSIGLGEDGPTHQPIEQLSTMRAMPNLHCWRPCDTTETACAWQQAIAYQGPSALALSRQTLPHQRRNATQVAHIAQGAYTLLDPPISPEIILIATGSEVSLAMQAATELNAQGLAVRVVSMPCMEIFAQQPASYQDAVLPSSVRLRVAIEAGATQSWHRWVGLEGKVIGIDRFGLSAPGSKAFEAMNITLEHVKQSIIQLKKQQEVST